MSRYFLLSPDGRAASRFSHSSVFLTPCRPANWHAERICSLGCCPQTRFDTYVTLLDLSAEVKIKKTHKTHNTFPLFSNSRSAFLTKHWKRSWQLQKSILISCTNAGLKSNCGCFLFGLHLPSCQLLFQITIKVWNVVMFQSNCWFHAPSAINN